MLPPLSLPVFAVFFVLLAGCTSLPGPGDGLAGEMRQRGETLTRGVNLINWFVYGPEQPSAIAALFPPEELARLRDLGFSFVRLPVKPWLLFDDADPGRPDPAMLAVLDQAIARVLAADLAVIVDLHSSGGTADEKGRQWAKLIEQDPDFLPRAEAFLTAFAAALAHHDPERLFFEPVNEPVFRGDEARWTEQIQPRLLAALRNGAPDHPLIAVGALWSRWEKLVAMAPYDDPNILYAFHFYDPVDFTHQGADWAGMGPVRGLAWPPNLLNGLKVAAGTGSAELAGLVTQYAISKQDAAALGAMIGQVGDWSRRHAVPVIAKEFGVYRPHAPNADRLAWLRTVRTAFEAEGIGWALWEYDGGFGLMQDGVADAGMLEALGLAGDAGS